MFNEIELQNEVEKIKQNFTQTRDIYREVCVLMFFRYGVTPTANKLYQYVKRGSMSAPAEALQKFWVELREKSRVQLDHPDLPEQLKAISGQLITTIWSEAQQAAQENFSLLAKQSNDEVASQKMAAQIANDALAKTKTQLVDTANENETLKLQINMLNNKLAEQNNMIANQDSALLTHELAYQALKNDHEKLATTILEMKASFSRDLDTYAFSLDKAEDRYIALEKKALLEVDHQRQLVIQQQKETVELKRIHDQNIKSLNKDKLAYEKKLLTMQEKLSMVSGRYAETSKQLRATNTEIKKLRSKLEQLSKKTLNK